MKRWILHLSVKLSFKWHDQFFYGNTFISLKALYLKSVFSKLLSHGSIEQDHLSKMRKMSVFGLFNKIINFITESVKKKKRFMTCYSSLDFLIPKMSINIHLKWKCSTRAVFTVDVFFSNMGPYIDGRPKMLICH